MLEHCQLTGHQLPTLGFLPFSSLGVVHGDLEDVTDGDQAGVSGDVTELVCWPGLTLPWLRNDWRC